MFNQLAKALSDMRKENRFYFRSCEGNLHNLYMKCGEHDVGVVTI